MTKENRQIPENQVVARLLALGAAAAKTFRGYVGASRTEGAITAGGEFSREFSPGERFYSDADELRRTYRAQG